MSRPMIVLAALSCSALAAYVAFSWRQGDLRAFLPGETTHGHHQIELACERCHTPFEGVRQDACVDCHGEELELADDSHPVAKFTDPRNADRVAELDARECTTCHLEHRPARTGEMGVTLPSDYCHRCHQDVANERPTHEGLAFDSCQSAGCHNFHDNRSLHEDYLEQHLGDPPMLERARLSMLLSTREAEEGQCASDVRAGAPVAECRACHRRAVAGFLGGKHGMRLAEELEPMRPELARRPMRDDAHGRSLDCGSCHGPRGADPHTAAVEACLGCHSDEHSLAYRGSAHARLWRAEVSGSAPEGTGVSCATCHLPRVALDETDHTRFVVQHNQNDNLRPNEKMIRGVCAQCHGVGFVLDALADAQLVKRNFTGRPTLHVRSTDMVEEKLAAVEASRAP